MCGIVGVVGNRNAVPILVEGLKRLEYRGYDSAGIAVFENGDLSVRKTKGPLAGLESVLEASPVEGEIGIGHTRWATHGEPSTANSHPHTSGDQNIALVHNGIIENDHELKQALKDEGSEFLSETDTEVLVHLIASCTRKAGGDIRLGLREALKSVRGAYAIGVLDQSNPDVIYAARMKSPLVIGLGNNENFIASDVPAVLKQIQQVIYLDDGEIAEVRSDSIQITDLDGAPVEHEIKDVDLQAEDVDKAGFETFMLKEMHEQTRVLQGLLDQHFPDAGGVEIPELNMSDDELKNLSRMIIVSCGTAFYAAMYGRLLIEQLTSIAVETDLASEFRYRSPKISASTLIAAVSQSGETADTMASIEMARNAGCPVFSICNVEGSSLTRVSDHLIFTKAGPEIGVASTKAFTAQLMAFVMFALRAALVRGEMDADEAEVVIRELRRVPSAIHQVLQRKDQIHSIAEKHYEGPSALYLGRRFNYPIALEGALKNKEISYQHAEGYAAGEMKHGPIALINEYLPVVCICTDTEDDVVEKMISNVREVKSRAGRIIAIISDGDTRMNDIAEDLIEVPRTLEALSPMVNVVALQLLAYYAAQARGTDIDKPRNLAKSVTVE